MKKTNAVGAVLGVLLLIGCSKSEDARNLVPEISYTYEIEGSFYKAGTSNAPEVEWNGEKGQFGLESAVNDISIDKEMGIISWNKTLALGDQSLTVLAFNNSGTANTTVMLRNALAGTFQGTHKHFGEEKSAKITFNRNGSSVLIYNGGEPMEGEWKYENNELRSSTEFASQIYFLRGTINHNQIEAWMDGIISLGSTGSNKFFSTPIRIDLVQ